MSDSDDTRNNEDSLVVDSSMEDPSGSDHCDAVPSKPLSPIAQAIMDLRVALGSKMMGINVTFNDGVIFMENNMIAAYENVTKVMKEMRLNSSSEELESLRLSRDESPLVGREKALGLDLALIYLMDRLLLAMKSSHRALAVVSFAHLLDYLLSNELIKKHEVTMITLEAVLAGEKKVIKELGMGPREKMHRAQQLVSLVEALVLSGFFRDTLLFSSGSRSASVRSVVVRMVEISKEHASLANYTVDLLVTLLIELVEATEGDAVALNRMMAEVRDERLGGKGKQQKELLQSAFFPTLQVQDERPQVVNVAFNSGILKLKAYLDTTKLFGKQSLDGTIWARVTSSSLRKSKRTVATITGDIMASLRDVSKVDPNTPLPTIPKSLSQILPALTSAEEYEEILGHLVGPKPIFTSIVKKEQLASDLWSFRVIIAFAARLKIEGHDVPLKALFLNGGFMSLLVRCAFAESGDLKDAYWNLSRVLKHVCNSSKPTSSTQTQATQTSVELAYSSLQLDLEDIARLEDVEGVGVVLDADGIKTWVKNALTEMSEWLAYRNTEPKRQAIADLIALPILRENADVLAFFHAVFPAKKKTTMHSLHRDVEINFSNKNELVIKEEFIKVALDNIEVDHENIAISLGPVLRKVFSMVADCLFQTTAKGFDTALRPMVQQFGQNVLLLLMRHYQYLVRIHSDHVDAYTVCFAENLHNFVTKVIDEFDSTRRLASDLNDENNVLMTAPETLEEGREIHYAPTSCVKALVKINDGLKVLKHGKHADCVSLSIMAFSGALLALYPFWLGFAKISSVIGLLSLLATSDAQQTVSDQDDLFLDVEQHLSMGEYSLPWYSPYYEEDEFSPKEHYRRRVLSQIPECLFFHNVFYYDNAANTRVLGDKGLTMAHLENANSFVRSVLQIVWTEGRSYHDTSSIEMLKKFIFEEQEELEVDEDVEMDSESIDDEALSAPTTKPSSSSSSSSVEEDTVEEKQVDEATKNAPAITANESEESSSDDVATLDLLTGDDTMGLLFGDEDAGKRLGIPEMPEHMLSAAAKAAKPDNEAILIRNKVLSGQKRRHRDWAIRSFRDIYSAINVGTVTCYDDLIESLLPLTEMLMVYQDDLLLQNIAGIVDHVKTVVAQLAQKRIDFTKPDEKYTALLNELVNIIANVMQQLFADMDKATVGRTKSSFRFKKLHSCLKNTISVLVILDIIERRAVATNNAEKVMIDFFDDWLEKKKSKVNAFVFNDLATFHGASHLAHSWYKHLLESSKDGIPKNLFKRKSLVRALRPYLKTIKSGVTSLEGDTICLKEDERLAEVLNEWKKPWMEESEMSKVQKRQRQELCTEIKQIKLRKIA